MDIALRGDTGNLDKALSKSEKSVGDFASKTSKAGGGAGDALGALGGGAGVAVGAIAAVAAAAVAAGAALAAFVASSMQGVDNLARTAATLGLTTTALAGLQHGAAVAGVETETFNGALEKFQKHISEAGQGNAEVIASFAKLGLNIADLKDIPVEQAMGRVGDALAKTGSEADKLQITLALFGKSAGPLKEVLKGGSEGMAAMQEEAKKLGLAVSGEQAAQVQAATAGWRKFMEAITGIGRSLAVVFAPVITRITDAIVAFTSEGAGGLSSSIKFWQELVSVAWELGKAFFEFYYTINGVLPLFNLISEALGSSNLSWQQWQQIILQAAWTTQFYLTTWKDQAVLIFSKIGLAAITMGNDFVHVFTDVIPKSIEALGEALADLKAGRWDGIADRFAAKIKDSLKRDATDVEKGLAAAIAEKERGNKEGLEAFLAKKLADFNKAAKKDEAPGKGDQLGGVFAKPAAMEFGSKEAFSVLYGTQSAADKALAVANDQLNQDKKMVKLLEKILEVRFGIPRARL